MSTAVLAMVWTVLANVKCSDEDGGQYCRSEYPICCGREDDMGRAYCYKGGFTCCDNDFGRSSGGCPENTKCCKHGMGSYSCCEPDEICTSDGCREDSCTMFTSQDMCVVSGCGWCCGSNKCGAAAVHSCEELITNATETCSDPCSGYKTCQKCVQGDGCGWCCSSGVCMSGNMSEAQSKCSKFSFLGEWWEDGEGVVNDENCAVCDRGGDGVVSEPLEEVDKMVWIGVIVVLPLVLSCVFVVGAFCFSALGRRGRRRSPTHNPSDPFTDDVRVVKTPEKYNFPSCPTPASPPPPHTPTPPYDECVACYDAIATTTFLPCNHTCCCASCALKLEAVHVSKQASTREASTLPLCPLCREAITHMVNREEGEGEEEGGEGDAVEIEMEERGEDVIRERE